MIPLTKCNSEELISLIKTMAASLFMYGMNEGYYPDIDNVLYKDIERTIEEYVRMDQWASK